MTNYSDYRTSTIRTLFKAANYTAKPNEYLWVDSSSSALTMTLPASPGIGANVRVGDASQNAAVNPITVARNGNTINGLAEDFIIDENNGVVDFVWTGTTWSLNVPMFGTGGLTEAQADARVVAVAPGVAKLGVSVKAYVANINDEDIFTLTFGGDISTGIVILSDNSNSSRGIFAFRARPTAFITAMSSTGFVTSTNDLTVTPGGEGQVTISATDTNLFQINNRSGGGRVYSVLVSTPESGNFLP